MTAFGAVLAAGLGVLAVAGLLDLAVGARWPRLRGLPYLVGAAGSACLAVAGAGALAGHPARLAAAGWPGAGWLGAGTAGLVADRLSGLFLVIAFGAAVAVSLAFASWAARPGAVGRRGLGASYALTLGAVGGGHHGGGRVHLPAGVGTGDGRVLPAGRVRAGPPGRPGGALVTLVFGKISGAALLVGLLLLAVRSGSLDLTSFAHVPGGVARATAQVAARRRFRGQGRTGPVPGLAAPRVRGRARDRPGRSWPASRSMSASTACGGPWPCSARRPPG